MPSILLHGTRRIPELEGSPVSQVCLYSHIGGQEWTSNCFCRREKVVIEPKATGVASRSSFSLSLTSWASYSPSFANEELSVAPNSWDPRWVVHPRFMPGWLVLSC